MLKKQKLYTSTVSITHFTDNTRGISISTWTRIPYKGVTIPYIFTLFINQFHFPNCLLSTTPSVKKLMFIHEKQLKPRLNLETRSLTDNDLSVTITLPWKILCCNILSRSHMSPYEKVNTNPTLKPGYYTLAYTLPKQNKNIDTIYRV